MNKYEFEIDSSKLVREVRTKTRLIGGLFYIKGIEVVDINGESLMTFETSADKGDNW